MIEQQKSLNGPLVLLGLVLITLTLATAFTFVSQIVWRLL